MVPPPDMPQSIMVNDDVDAGWAEVGESLLADAMPYFAWNQEAGLAAGTVSLTEAARSTSCGRPTARTASSPSTRPSS